jgi:CHASE3 domain sensor protein
MKRSLWLMTVILSGLIGCGEEGKAMSSRHSEEVNRLRSELQEIRTESAAEKRGAWKSWSLVAVSLGAVMLFIGAGLGAGARRDARKKRL